jgi:tRNA threonylcarbamoyladenosine biosynthesis protein TsaE
MTEAHICKTPDETFELGLRIGEKLLAGDVLLLHGGLGSGKTLLTKGILDGLDFDIDEVTSPSFTLVNLYRARFDVYHIDLWRLDDGGDVAGAIGLDEILNAENSVTIIEWAEKLRNFQHDGRVISVTIEGDGDDPRQITIV